MLYCRFVNAAVHCHKKISCSITHKVHLMCLHVWVQMKKIPGGLGEKMEDWVELQHQSGSRKRRRFRTTRDREVRAIARAQTAHRGANADVIRQQESVKELWRQNFKDNSDKVSVEIQRRAKREATRFAALEAFKTQRCAAVFLRRWWTPTRLKRGCDGESCTVLALGESRG